MNFRADKPLPPPPIPQSKPRNESLASTLTTYRQRPQPATRQKDNQSQFSSARALFESNTVRSGATSAARFVAAHPDESKKIAAFGIDQAQKHPEATQRLASAAVNNNTAVVAPPRPSNNDAAAAPRPSMNVLRSQLENKLTFDSPPTTKNARPVSCEPIRSSATIDNFSISSFDSTPAPSHDRLRPSLSFSSRKTPPKRPPPPKIAVTAAAGNSRTMSPTEPHATAKYPFNGSHFDELSCQLNDIILLKREVDDQWIYGFNTRTGQHGIIPIAFLQIKVPLSPTPTVRMPVISTGPRCRALFDYTSNAFGDLQFATDDIIRLLERVNNEWLKGETADGRRGIFPSNFVQIIEDLSNVTSAPPPTDVVLCTVKALHNFVSTNDNVDDLTFNRDDIIDVIEYVNDEWWRGRLRRSPDRVGMFPANFVENILTPASTKSSSDMIGRQVTALYDYRGTDGGDLWFTKGDRILVTAQVDGNWLRGRLDMPNTRTIPEGIFPKNFVI